MADFNTTDGIIISIENITKSYIFGDRDENILKSISLKINTGEMVAIIGPSGSGKSTLMNIIGCLDKPSSGKVNIAGMDTVKADSDKLSDLRSRHIGFIFQRYNLIPYLSALDNVIVPACYTAMSVEDQQRRAHFLLNSLGLSDRTSHKPHELSGGQQQRVSIARALMNGASIILADEPTGALDEKSGQELMKVLHTLHKNGQTIILVTHDSTIAQQADRIIQLADGEILSDNKNHKKISYIDVENTQHPLTTGKPSFWRSLRDAAIMAWVALNGHRIRALLSMLGIIIGVSSVITTMAVGEGMKQRILDDINDMGVKTLSIMPGATWGDKGELYLTDVSSLKKQNYIEMLSPVYNQQAVITANGKDSPISLFGVNSSYIDIRGMEVTAGRFFDQWDEQGRNPVLVIDNKTAAALFPEDQQPVGKIVQLSGIPFVIIGVVNTKSSYSDIMLLGWTPFTTICDRMMTSAKLQSIEAKPQKNISLRDAKDITERLIYNLHQRKDFNIQTDDMMKDIVSKTSDSMTLLIAIIAGISLVVGGIGVMNIMLVSVTERTREIGIRLAIGARKKNILHQFLVESVVICLLGCVISVILTLCVGRIYSAFNSEYQLIFRLDSIIFSCLFSISIGLIFGFFPARNAAKLNPVEALVRE